MIIFGVVIIALILIGSVAVMLNTSDGDLSNGDGNSNDGE